MQTMTLKEFMEFHPEFTDGDMRLVLSRKFVLIRGLENFQIFFFLTFWL